MVSQRGFLPTLVAVAIAAAACTPGAQSAPNVAGAVPGATIIEVSLLQYGPSQTPDGTVAGYSPANITVRVGAIVQFHNQDSFAHTASFVGTSFFPQTSPLTSAALSQQGHDLTVSGWSTGELAAGAYSQPLVAGKSGTVFYGCYYHYGSPMRAKITIQ